jgi:hypothetical protein
MTEQEWLKTTDPTVMVEFLRGTISDRKWRLLICELMRHDPTIRSANARKSIELGERLADGEITSSDAAAYCRATPGEPGLGDWVTLLPHAIEAVEIAVESGHSFLTHWIPHLLREIVDNPFRPVTLNPAWLTSTVVALATGINSEKAFDRMPILADALQDAGCDKEDILIHLQGPGPHVKGCWALDLILGKT